MGKKKRAKPPRHSNPESCVCAESQDGQYYCYKKVQGKWVSCRGPYASLEACRLDTDEQCKPTAANTNATEERGKMTDAERDSEDVDASKEDDTPG